MSKILFLGHEGSGKTVLMGILSRYFEAAGDGKWGLNPKNQDAFTFMEFVPVALAAGKWPAQTTLDGIRRFEWNVEYNGETYTTIEMVDYPGEAFRTLFDQSQITDILNGLRPDCTILSELIRAAENIFLVINPSDILQNQGNIKRAETIWQLCEAVDYLKTLPKKPKFTLVLTQMDRYCDSAETLNAKQILLNANALFAKRGFKTLDIIGVSAVGKTVKNHYGDAVPDMTHGHPINLAELTQQFLKGTKAEEEINSLTQTIAATSTTPTVNTTSLTLCEQISKIVDSNNLVRNITNKYGYLLGELLFQKSKHYVETNECIIQELNTRLLEIRQEEEKETNVKIGISKEHLMQQLSVINSKESFTYHELCTWFNTITEDCQFLRQHEPSYIPALEVLKLRNIVSKTLRNGGKQNYEKLRAFENKYPFAKNVYHLVCDYRRTYVGVSSDRMNAISSEKVALLKFPAHIIILCGFLILVLIILLIAILV